MTGHIGYVKVVNDNTVANPLAVPPVDYGLAGLREERLFGLVERVRPLDESSGRWVFAWGDVSPDPREAVDLAPTGDHARVLDRFGTSWVVYEFIHGGGHYAYGVAIDGPYLADGAPRDVPPGIDPDHGMYNYAITYRVDKLFPDLFDGGAPLERTPGKAEGSGTVTMTVLFGVGDAPPLHLDLTGGPNALGSLFDHDLGANLPVPA